MHIRHLPSLLLVLYRSAEALRVTESDIFPLGLSNVPSLAEADKLLPACLPFSEVMLFTGEPMKLSRQQKQNNALSEKKIADSS